MPVAPAPKTVTTAPLKPILKPTTKATLEPGSKAAPNDRSNGSGNALRSGLAAARAPSQAPPNAPTGPRVRSVAMADLPPRVPRTTIKSVVMADDEYRDEAPQPYTQEWKAKGGFYDPSMGPARSAMTAPFCRSVAASRASTARSTRAAYFDTYCRMTNYTRRDFRLGDVISAPFHTSNTNPQYEKSLHEGRITITREGPAFSKRRMMVVVFIHLQDLHCLPLYSFGNRGLKEKPEYLKKEYVCMANEGDKDFVNQGLYPPVRVNARHAVSGNTTVHLTGGLRVGCNEDISIVGRLTRPTFYALAELWQKMVVDAKKEPW